MTIDAESVKQQVNIVNVIGQFVELKPTGSTYTGMCPFHDETGGSFNVDPNRQSFKCFGCEEQGDVIDFVQKHKSIDFKAAVEFLGGEIKEDRPPAKKKPKPKPAKPVPLDYESAKNHYTRDIMQDRADYILDRPHEFKHAWPYKNKSGEVELVAVRFEDNKGHKTVLSMYWNGKTIKLAGYPVLLFNRDLIANNPTKPILIVEGEKAAEAAAALPDFVATTWNGGHGKADSVDWSPLKNREVFILPDDDHQKYKNNHPRAGQILPAHEQPGNKAAAKIKKKLPHAKIVAPVTAARKIKKSGADIVEILEVMSPGQITEHILATVGDQPTSNDVEESEQPPRQAPSSDIYPFKVLGIADDGKAYYIGQNDRLYSLNPLSLTKAQLYNLIDINWWHGAYSDEGKGGKMWEMAMSDLVTVTNNQDFDPDRMRGRGAWREPDGRICYHDGKKTTGEWDKDRIFIRRPFKKIGLDSKPATIKQRETIRKAAKELNFETLTDMVRILGWTVLAPFAGALPWRPSILLTAASGSGKSAIVNVLVNRISRSLMASGEISTPVGVRQHVGVDSMSVIIEEAEEKRDEYFSLMRQSTSDDTPDALKGTTDGKGIKFKLRSMFMFVSIDPTINKEGDENRIFMVGLRKGKHNAKQWAVVEKNMIAAMPESVCNGVRSFVWENLPLILKLADELNFKVQIAAKTDTRTAYADSLIIAAYLVVFRDEKAPTDEYMDKFLAEYYGTSPLGIRRNENEEMVDILLDSIIRDGSANYTIRELLNAIETGVVWSNKDDQEEGEPREEREMEKHYARQLAGRYGMGLAPDGNIAIAKNHKEIMNMLDKGKGYQMQLMRHPRLVERGKNVALGSRNVKNCVVIGWERDHE